MNSLEVPTVKSTHHRPSEGQGQGQLNLYPPTHRALILKGSDSLWSFTNFFHGGRAIKIKQCWPWHGYSMSWNGWPGDPSGWQVGREELYGFRECFTTEETGSERLSDCLGSHSNLRRELSLEELVLLTLSPGLHILLSQSHSTWTAGNMVVCVCVSVFAEVVGADGIQHPQRVRKLWQKNLMDGAVGSNCLNTQVPRLQGI